MPADSTATKEQRGRDRRAIQARVRIVWVENGIARQTMGDIRDISPKGMSCWVPQRIAAGTEIRLECPPQHLHGDALVRHSNNKGARSLLGIEFRGSMTWRAPDEPPPAQPRWD